MADIHFRKGRSAGSETAVMAGTPAGFEWLKTQPCYEEGWRCGWTYSTDRIKAAAEAAGLTTSTANLHSP